jgi:hypothetical protein
MRSIRKATFGVATAGLLVATAACGSSDTGTEEPETRSQKAIVGALQASQEKTREATAAFFETEMTMTMQMEAGEDPMVLPMSMSGDVSWDPLAMDVTMDMTGYFAAFAEMFGSEEEMPSGEFDLRFVDNVMYMGGPMLTAELDGKSWVKVDLAAMAGEAGDVEAGELLEQFNQAEDMAQSPAEQIGMLLESPEITWRGTETMNGQETDAYEGELTVEELLAVDPSSATLTDEEIQELHEEYQEMGAEKLRFEVWVDQEEDYPVRIDMTLAMPEGSVQYTTSYSDYRDGIAVEHPADSEVADAAALEGSAGLFGGGGAASGSADDSLDGGAWEDDGTEMTDEELEELLRELEELEQG